MNLPRPAYWGKLPAYGDFVRQSAPSEVQEAWRTWLRGPLQRARQESRLADAHAMPWSFVMTPGCLEFSSDRYVAGVYAQSQDKFGREHPFLMWFLLDPAKVSSLLGTHDNALFCLSRLLCGHLTAPAPGLSEGLIDQINRLWRVPRGGLLRGLRRSNDGQDFAAARAWAHAGPSDGQTDGLAGVPYAPWRDWPSTIFGDSTQAWYWQQDAQAGYVSFLSVAASESADLD